MKKFGLMLFSLMLLFVSVGLFACNDDNQDSEIKSVTAQGLANTYQVTDTIPFDTTKLVVTYDNDKTATLTKGKVDGTLDDLKAENSNFEFVLLTNGLASQTAGEYELGEYQISCYVAGSDQKYDLLKIKIYTEESETYDLELFDAPEFVKTFNDRMHDAGKGMGEANENSFMKQAESYVVGDDNEFIFKPMVTLFSKDNPQTPVTNHNIDVKVQVHKIDGSSQTEVGSEIYTFNPETYGFQFTEAADGNTYQITMSPTSWTKDVDGEAITPVKFTVTVADGWNAYDALDLGRLNLVDNKADAATFGTYASSVRNVFYLEKNDGQGNITHEYGNIKYYELWEKFLTEKGEKDLHEIKALYLHNDITLTTADIPQEYIVGSNEPGADEYTIGSLRDFTFLYSHMMTSNFEFNGNMFNLDISQMPVNRTDAPLDDTFKLLKKGEPCATGGHSTTFAFVHKVGSEFVATIKNVNAKGNKNVTDNNGEAAQDASRALMFVKSLYGVCNADNTISKEFMIAWYPESEIGDKGLDLSNSKVFDCSQCGVFSFSSSKNTMTNCELRRFGGPAIFLIGQSYNRDDPAVTSGSKKEGQQKAQARIDTKNCVIESFIDGTEGWFAINGAGDLATTIKGLFGSAFTDTGSTLIQNVDGTDKINLQVLCLDSDYLNSSKYEIFTSFSSEEDDKPKFTFDTNQSFHFIRSALKSFPQEPPILQFNDSLKFLIPTNMQDLSQSAAVLVDTSQAYTAGTKLMEDPTPYKFTGKLTGDRVGVHYRKDNKCCIGIVLGMYPEAA